MQELVNQLVEKTGIDKPTAEKLGNDMKNNLGDVTTALTGGLQAIVQLLERFGLGKVVAAKVAEFLQAHAADIPKWLASDAGKSVLGSVMSTLGKAMGGKKEG